MNGHSSNDGILRDYCDSEQYKMHALFGQPGNALLLHCYYDDFQVTNPLGSKTKKHKIGMLSIMYLQACKLLRVLLGCC